MPNRQDRQKDYAQAANGPQRLRLFSWPKIIAFSIFILVVLVLLYPREKLIRQVGKSGAQDALSRHYLDNLLKTEPDNPSLLVKRAEIQISAGREEEAETLLLELNREADPALKIRIAYALIMLREQQAFTHPPDTERRKRYLPALHQALSMLGDLPLDLEARARLAEKATAYGAADLAIRLYRSLVEETDHVAALGWIEKAARTAQSLGRYREAASLYFEARRRSPAREQQVTYYLAGVRALQAGNLPLEALDAAERELGDLASDRNMLLFMVELARSANRLDRAEIYVRMLLQYAAWGGTHPAFQQVSASRQSWPSARSDALDLSRQLPACGKQDTPAYCWQRLPGSAPLPPEEGFHKTGSSPLLPFDEEIYNLGYEVFLANRNLGEAYLVAEAAVRQAPNNTVWRQRLAQVAEWHGKPAIALEHWKYLALNHDSERAWQALLRLAPGLFDEKTVAMALTREHRLGRLDDRRLLRLIEAYESLGEAQKGIEFLQLAYRNNPRRRLLERQYWLEERMGLTDRAIGSLRLLDKTYGLTLNETQTLAALLITQGKFEEAYRELRRHENAVTRKNRAYQTLMAELAWRLQDKQNARRLYQALQSGGPMKDHETERLVLLIREHDPGAAARLAARHWEQYRVYRFLTIALELQLQNRNLAAARDLLTRPTGAELVQYEKQPDFLQLRAEVWRRSGDLPAAVADIRQALVLTPGDANLGAQLIWLLIESRDSAGLAVELKLRHPRALGEPLLWGPMGAGYALLSKPNQALPYYARQAAAKKGDYLWQIGYAQVLEETGHADMAWRLRRHAWVNLRRDGKPDQARQEHWQAIAQLALRMAPGDAGTQWLRESLRQDLNGDQQLSAESKELATAFYLSHEQHESARIWLAQQYGKQLAAPGWAEAALALQRNDRASLEKIIQGSNDGIEPATRVDAALQLRRYHIARKLADAGLDIDPDNDTLHLQLTESVWQLQNRAGLAYRRETLGDLESESWQVSGQWHVTPRLRMGVTLSQADLSSKDTTRLANLPGQDLKLVLAGTLANENSETGIRLHYRDALDAVVGVELEHQLRIDRRLRLGIVLGYNADADENDVLKAGGAKDALTLNAEWLIGRREYLLAELFASRYYGQDRNFLGQGTGLAVQLGHHFRTEYPDATIKLLGSVYRFDESNTAGSSILALLPPGSAVLPGNLSQFGIGIGLGETVIDQFSRDLRPYAALDLLHDSTGGWGYSLETGFVLSPTGHDWLRGRYRSGRGGLDNREDAMLLELEYRYLF